MGHTVLKTVRRILIVGGGTSGWMAAAALSARYRGAGLQITLVESEGIGGVGVGEATVPGIRLFHQRLGISEQEFIQATKATFKLGIEFQDWYLTGQRFFHPFSAFGVDIAGQDFYQCWLKLQREGHVSPLEDFSLAAAMARAGRFAQPDSEAAPLARYNYAYHFDASLYAKFLRHYAEARDVVRVEGKIVATHKNTADGSVASVQLENGATLTADLFIDCSGFRALLIEQCLATGFDNWSQWLPCDSALAVQTESLDSPSPYTISHARPAGWQWRIPLQHRKGNGYVFCSTFIDRADAEQTLLENLDGPIITAPRLIEFTTGIRRQFWNKNCVALGLASGFIEPLESTSISLIHTGIDKLIQFLPDLVLDPENIAEANRLNRLEYEQIRDFIVLHYKASARADSEFWRYIKTMALPDTLAKKITSFKQDGALILFEQESFMEQSWLAIYNGFNIFPQDIRPAVKALDAAQLKTVFEKMRRAIVRGTDSAPTHAEFIADVYRTV